MLCKAHNFLSIANTAHFENHRFPVKSSKQCFLSFTLVSWRNWTPQSIKDTLRWQHWNWFSAFLYIHLHYGFSTSERCRRSKAGALMGLTLYVFSSQSVPRTWGSFNLSSLTLSITLILTLIPASALNLTKSYGLSRSEKWRPSNTGALQGSCRHAFSSPSVPGALSTLTLRLTLTLSLTLVLALG